MELFDLHCDTAYEVYKTNRSFKDSTLCVTAKKASFLNKWTQLFAVWVKDDLQNPFDFLIRVLTCFKGQLSAAKALLPKNFTPIFALEGGAAIEKLECVDAIYNEGVKAVTLTWNGKNKIASGCDTVGGLTDYGAQVIERMNTLFMATDLSHLNEQSFFDAVEVAKYPLATHSNCSSVYAHKRNLSDKQIAKIARKGGIIGLCPYPAFLGKDSFEGIYDNLSYMLSLGYENCVCFGSDFDGAVMSESLSDISKIGNLYSYLRKKGIDDYVLAKFFYKNAQNFFQNL